MAIMSPLAQALTGRRTTNRLMAPTRPAVGGYAPSPFPRTSDPDQTASQVTPADFPDRNLPAQSPVTTDGRGLTDEQRKKLLSEAEADFRDARSRKGLIAPVFLESRRVFGGDPYQVWDTRAGRWRDSRPDGWEDEGRRYEHRPLIVGKVMESKARVTRNDPDIGVSPETSSQGDTQAAHEARAVLRHYDEEWNNEVQVLAAWQEACIATPCWKVYFDPSADDDVPQLAPDGTVQGVQKQRVGRIKRELVPWEQWFSPSGNFYKTWDDITLPWLIHCRPVKLSEIEAYYAGGYNVDAEPGVSGDTNLMATDGYVQAGMSRGFDSQKLWALLKERYELPTPALEAQGYPDGRITTWANGYLLDVRNMEDGFPFFPIYFTKMENDPDGMNYVGRLLSSQRSINALVSKAREHSELPAFHVLAANQTSFNPNSYKGREGKYINYTGGPPPQYQVRPPFPADSMNLLTFEMQMFDRISGITPGADMASPDASGKAFESRMEQDISAVKDQTTNLHAAQIWSANRLLRLVAKYKDTPSLVAMQSPTPGQDPARGVMTFRGLNAGGRVRLRLSPDSAIPQMPGQQQELVQSIFGNLTPDNAPLIAAMLKASDMAGTSPLYEALGEAIQQMQASQPDPAQIAQQEQAHKAELQAAQDHQADAAAQRQEAVDAELIAVKQHGEQEMQAMKHQFETTQAQMNAQLQVLLKGMPSVAGSMDAVGVEDWEQQHGIKGEVPPVPTAAPAIATKPKRKG